MVMPLLAAGLAGGIVGYVVGRDGQARPVDINQLIEALKRVQPVTYKVIELDGTEARSDREISVAGTALVVLADTSDTQFTVRMNEPGFQAISLTRVKRIIGGFYRIFVSNSAGTTGTLTLVAGKGMDIERSELTGDHNLLDNVTPDDHHAQDHAVRHAAGGADDLSGSFQVVSEKGAANGYAELDSNGDVPDAQIPTSIARDSEVSAAYQALSEKGVANGYASLDVNGDVPDAQIPSSITRDTELNAHEAAADPHTGYQKESEKGQPSGYAELDVNGDVPDAQIPSAITRDTELNAHEGDVDAHHAKYTDAEARAAVVEDEAYGATWDADTTHAPSKNAVYDKIEALDAAKSDAGHTHSQIATGSYTGDGTTSQGITGIGFQPKYVKIWKRDVNSGNSIDIWETTAEILDDHVNAMSVSHLGAGGHQVIANEIASLDADGFTVDGAGSDPNASGISYNYLVIG